MKKVFLLFCFILFGVNSYGQKELLKLHMENEPFYLTAKKVRYDSKNNIVEAYGDVHIYSSNYNIYADYGRYEKREKKVYLKGKVSAKWDSNSIKGEELVLYVSNSTGWIRGGEIFYSVPHLYFRGDKIYKTGKNTFSFSDIEVTGCDGKVPDWSFWIKSGEIAQNGEAYLHHVNFRIKNKNLAYLPYLQLPVLIKRKSGFLVPEYSSSSLDGTGLIVPYYLVISKEQDMTVYPGYFSKRGVFSGVEYRFVPDVKTRGFFMASYLRDKVTYLTEDNAPYSLNSDNLIRPNKNRYWIRGKLNGYLFSPDIEVKLDIDYVSDQDFLREFDSGYLGFDRSREVFLDVFGRDINNKDSFIRQNTLLIQRNYDIGSLYLKTEYLEDVRYKNHNLDPSRDTTITRLPEIGFNMYKTPVAHGLFDLESRSSVVYFLRRYSVQGTRFDLYPTISKTMSSDYFTLIPKLSFRDTFYVLKDRDRDDMDGIENRYLFEAGLDSYAQFYRVYNFGDVGLIRHIISPEVEYFYRSVKTRDDLPVFDSIDQIQREQRITYSLDNHFVFKTYGKEKKPIYKNILRLKLSQTYDIKEARRERDLDKYPRRPFTDLRIEYEFTPSPRFSFNGNIWVSPYIKGIVESEQRADFRFLDSLSGFVSHDYKRKLTQDIHRIGQTKESILGYGIKFSPNNRWEMSYSDTRDIHLGEVIEQKLTLNYTHQCWILSTELSHTQDDDKIMIVITFGSLGEVSQGFSL